MRHFLIAREDLGSTREQIDEMIAGAVASLQRPKNANCIAAKNDTVPPLSRGSPDIQDLWAYIARDNIEVAARVRREIRVTRILE